MEGHFRGTGIRHIQICFRVLPPEEELDAAAERVEEAVEACMERQREGAQYCFILDGATPIGGYIPREHWGCIDCRREDAAARGRRLSVDDYLILADEALVFYHRDDPLDRAWLEDVRAAAQRMEIDIYPVALPKQSLSAKNNAGSTDT